jgi:hypothetical protein
MLFRSESRGGGVMDRLDIAIARAFDIGRDHGMAAGEHYLEVRGASSYAYPDLYVYPPEPDLSGEWADQPSGPIVFQLALMYAGFIPDREYDGGDLFSEVCDAYAEGFHAGVERIAGVSAR